jgi:non-specific serine/threonine protein kinase
MSLEVAISPGGRLFVIPAPEAMPVVNEQWASRLQAAFDASAAEGLLLLATDALTLSVPPSPTYWRDFARGYLQRLCQTGGVDGGPVPVLPSERERLSEFVQEAPPVRGGEFLTFDLLARLWQEFGALVTRESAATGLAGWLKSKNPLWHTVGRVTFHLAENKRDPARPFAFLATYTHRLSDQGKPQHLPLARALQEYAGAKNKAALTNLLAPVQRAAEKSELAHELIETRRLFQPTVWSPRDAHRFLRDIPLFEESGLLIRVPDWWKGGRPARPRVNVRIG